MKCKYCNKIFQPRKTGGCLQKFCSKNCQIIHKNKMRSPVKYKKKRCKWCHRWFIPRTIVSNGCSIFCQRRLANRKWRLGIKRLAVAYKGGRCKLCGYNKCLSALEFHHRNPKKKDLEIASNYHATNTTLKRELDTCDLLCANCHRELHEKLNNK